MSYKKLYFNAIFVFRNALITWEFVIGILKTWRKYDLNFYSTLPNTSLLKYLIDVKAKLIFKDAIGLSRNESSFLMLAKIFLQESNIAAAIEILSKAAEYEITTLINLIYIYID